MKMIAILLFLSSYVCYGQEPGKDKKVVLFVCEHGAARSLLASTYFNKLAAEKGLDYTSIFRGTLPDSVLNPFVVQGLAKDGLVVPDQQPIPVSATDEQLASRIVTFDCAVPIESKKPKENWANIAPVGKDYNKAREEILKHVHELIAKLEKEKAGLEKK